MKTRILNVGCGNETYGTDRIDIVKTKTTTKVCDIEKRFPFEDNTFDEVYCSYVLEHMKNPYNLILEIKRVCRVGGRIVIITDNAGYIFRHLKGRYHGDYSDKDVHGKNYNPKDKHYSLFTPEHLRNYFRTAGITVVDVKPSIWDNISNKSLIKHWVLSWILPQRFILPSIVIMGVK